MPVSLSLCKGATGTVPSGFPPENLLARVGDFAWARGPRSLAAFGARAAAAARADDAGRLAQRILREFVPRKCSLAL